MDRLAALFDQLIQTVTPWAEQAGAPGLFLIALFDSSFLSFPQVADALLIGLTIAHPSHAPYYVVATTLGSLGGCFTLYTIGRKSGESFLRKKFKDRHIDRGLALIQRHGWLAVAVPSLLPPPTPFKLITLLAGVADLRPLTFVAALILGRGVRFGVQAWLAYHYGDRAVDFARNNMPMISLWLAVGIGVAVVVTLLVRRQRASRA